MKIIKGDLIALAKAGEFDVIIVQYAKEVK